MVSEQPVGRESDSSAMLGLLILVVVDLLVAIVVGIALGLFIGSISALR